MEMESLRELFVDELKDLYSAENQILKALPKMVKAATSKELKAGFQEHLEQTKEHVTRLEKIFKRLGMSPKGRNARAWKVSLKTAKN
jgi:ferritin-like metal-binding protein YciE